jgi:hypothetical protein
VQRGDVALIEVWPTRQATAWVFRGGPNSTQGDPVTEIFWRMATRDDTYCVSGATTGELCGYTVVATGVNVFYLSGEWADNMVQGSRLGTCTTVGDSGAPVFSPTTGGVSAKGVHSGGGAFGPFCDEYFTDIWHPINALPGTVKTRP